MTDERIIRKQTEICPNYTSRTLREFIDDKDNRHCGNCEFGHITHHKGNGYHSHRCRRAEEARLGRSLGYWTVGEFAVCDRWEAIKKEGETK